MPTSAARYSTGGRGRGCGSFSRYQRLIPAPESFGLPEIGAAGGEYSPLDNGELHGPSCDDDEREREPVELDGLEVSDDDVYEGPFSGQDQSNEELLEKVAELAKSKAGYKTKVMAAREAIVLHIAENCSLRSEMDKLVAELRSRNISTSNNGGKQKLPDLSKAVIANLKIKCDPMETRAWYEQMLAACERHLGHDGVATLLEAVECDEYEEIRERVQQGTADEHDRLVMQVDNWLATQLFSMLDRTPETRSETLMRQMSQPGNSHALKSGYYMVEKILGITSTAHRGARDELDKRLAGSYFKINMSPVAFEAACTRLLADWNAQMPHRRDDLTRMLEFIIAKIPNELEQSGSGYTERTALMKELTDAEYHGTIPWGPDELLAIIGQRIALYQRKPPREANWSQQGTRGKGDGGKGKGGKGDGEVVTEAQRKAAVAKAGLPEGYKCIYCGSKEHVGKDCTASCKLCGMKACGGCWPKPNCKVKNGIGDGRDSIGRKMLQSTVDKIKSRKLKEANSAFATLGDTDGVSVHLRPASMDTFPTCSAVRRSTRPSSKKLW